MSASRSCPSTSRSTTARSSSWPSTSGPAAERSPWKLPPGQAARAVRRPRRSTARPSRSAAAPSRHALAEHGVETRLVGMVVGPTVTRYELELGPGREGRPGHQPAQGHRLRDGVARRPHPRPDPRRQAIGVEVPNSSARSWPSATSSARRGSPQGEASARGGHRPRHQRPGRPGQPGDDAPHPHRRRDRRRQVVVHQLAASRRC